MDVKEFVTETLQQVTDAIKENNSSLNTGGVNIEALKKLNMFTHFNGWVTYVDFDIAVTESNSKDGGEKLSIAGVGGFGGDLSEEKEVASRVKFRVPIQIDHNENLNNA